jgi:hypothetical protein
MSAHTPIGQRLVIPVTGDCAAAGTPLCLCRWLCSRAPHRKNRGVHRPPDSKLFCPMHRLTAKALVLVLLMGAFAPYTVAAAFVRSPYAVGDHCARAHSPAKVTESSGCHHHATSTASETAPAVPPHDLRSKPCCNGHECCRSQVRAQWAQPRLRHEFCQSDRVETFVSAQAPQEQGFDEEAFRPVRAPPIA